MPPLPGNPDAVLGAAAALRATAARLREARDAVAVHGRAVTADWTGMAGPLALARIEQDARAIETAGEACERAAGPLGVFADELRRAQQDWADGERMAAEGQAAYAGAGSGAPVGADVLREQAVITVTDGTNVMLAAEERARVANEAAAKELAAATALLASITPPAPSPPVVGSDGNLGDGLLKAAGDVGTEIMSVLGGAVSHVNVFSDDFGSTWKNTWDTTTAAVSHPVEAVKAMVQGTVAPLGDSYRSGGIDEALGRSPGVIAGVIGGKGLTKLNKIDKLKGLGQTPIVPGGGLLRHEEAGGHTLTPLKAHVGATDQELVDRLTNSPRSLAGVSSYYDRATAERTISENLTANRGHIDAWLTTGSTRPKGFEWAHAQISGRYAPREATGVEDVRDVRCSRVVLVPDTGMPRGYRILTSFPRP